MQCEILNDHEGLRILGATQDFREFHELLHDINERSPVIFDKEGTFLGLAYDFRKAFEGARDIRRPKRGGELESTLVGFETLWPTILIQTRMLREALGFIDSSKAHQVLAYSLENTIEGAIPPDFQTQSEAVLAAYRRLDPTHPDLEAKTESRLEHWHSWGKKERELRVVELLNSLDPNFERVYDCRLRNGEVGLMTPDDWDAGPGFADDVRRH